MNTMANMGFFPRSGKNITDQTVKDVFLNVLGVGTDISDFFLNAVKEAKNADGTLSLDKINRHGLVEHDASLVRRDINVNPTNQIDPVLVNAIVAAAKDGKFLTPNDLGDFRRQRAKDAAADAKASGYKDFSFGLKPQFTAFGEAALLMEVFGGEQQKIPVQWLKTFLGNEELPADFTKRSTFHIPGLLAVAAQLKGDSIF
ncbi:hypothetical protein EDD86DRAFT_211066 [Gorgonomyces haynaldii]|nr:hypothetical protein EDD86DRAFT_211066 [Gorgonomyces haynaldii]